MKKGSFSQLFTLLCYAVAIGLELIVSALLTGAYTDGKLNDANYIYLSYLLPQICYLTSLGVFLAIMQVPLATVFRPDRVKPAHYLYALMIGLGLFFLALLPNYYLQRAFAVSGTSSKVLLPPIGTAGEVTLTVLLICVLPALGEEMLFRKTFCEGMKGNNEWVIMILGGLFFSLTHFNLVQTIHQFVLGCVLCFLYVRTENITLTVMIHFLNNLLAIFLTGWTAGLVDWESVAALSVSFVIGALLIAGGCLIVLKKTMPVRSKGEVTPYTVGMIVFVGIIWLVSVITSFI